jgi:hypothetical protein
MPLGTSYGYPVKTADELGLTDYFRKNPKVAGMAWGGGLNGTDVKEPRVIVANPFNRHMADPNKMQGLLKIEAAMHLMDETGYAPEFELSEEQQEWRKKEFGKDAASKAYAEDDIAFKRSIISRIGVDKVSGVTPEQKAEADRINAILDERENPDFVKSIMSNLGPEINAAQSFLDDWYDRRKITDPHIQEGLDKDAPYIEENLPKPPKVEIQKEIDGDPRITGQYLRDEGRLLMTPNADSSVPLHELTHHVNQAGLGGGFMRTIHKDIVANEIKPKDQQKGVYKDKFDYFANPDEVHARIMVLRQQAGFQPDKTITEQDLEGFLQDYDGNNDNINDLLEMSKGRKSILNMLNFMASVPRDRSTLTA